MWSIGDMKERGWTWVRHMYGPAYAACLICFILENLGNGEMNPFLPLSTGRHWLEHHPSMGFFQEFFLLFGVLALIVSLGLVGLAVKYFVVNPLEVGLCRYFLKSREAGPSAGVGTVFSVFTGGGYWNMVKVLFLRDLYTFLWTLLLVIPGICKSYEYRMIPYLLAEYPQMGSREIFARTRALMAGNRLQGFLLDLSFIGWNSLAVCAGNLLVRVFAFAFIMGAAAFCFAAWLKGAVILLVSPYIHAAWTELYLYLNHYPEVINRDGF